MAHSNAWGADRIVAFEDGLRGLSARSIAGTASRWSLPAGTGWPRQAGAGARLAQPQAGVRGAPAGNRQQVARLERAGQRIGAPMQGAPCAAMQGAPPNA
jgi:hypothetical protein